MGSKTRAEKRRAEAKAADGHITVTNGDIFAAKEPLSTLLGKEWPVRTSFAIAKLANTLNGHLQSIEIARNQLVQKYGKSAEGKPGVMRVEEDTEEYPKFLEELSELLSIEVDVAASVVVLPASVNGVSPGITAGVLLPLLKFIELEEGNDEPA